MFEYVKKLIQQWLQMGFYVHIAYKLDHAFSFVKSFAY